MQHEFNIENDLAEVVYTLKSTLASLNIKILTEDVTEKKLNADVIEFMSKISSIKSILTSNTFKEINKEGKYMLSIKIYDLDQLSSYFIFSIFKIEEDNILPKNGYDMLMSGLCVFSKRLELYLATFDGCEKYNFNIIDETFTFKSYIKLRKDGKNLYSDSFNKHKINNFGLKYHLNSIPQILSNITSRGGIFVSSKKYSLIFLIYPLGLIIQCMNGNLFVNNENFQNIQFPRKMNFNCEFIFGNTNIVNSFIGKGSRC
jgi:hypothetical protein